MKKIIYIFLLTFISIFFTSCSTYEYINYSKKPNATYYLDKMKETSENINSIRIVESNFFKEIEVNKKDFNLIYDMLGEINKQNILEKYELSDNPLYRIYIDISTDKFVIDIYGDDVISIYPWDGNYAKEIYSIKDLALSLKAESIAKYLFENK
ncbi:DUF4883 family protein [Clostridium mediterraneense]|uniref:DUF4883 family protein n=1 Tax=Clostridium mediterraneense TaxID=1805472 RepID=UPI000833A39E|nr:DUF4883 family protein [Clostridium mediterraneense]